VPANSEREDRALPDPPRGSGPASTRRSPLAHRTHVLDTATYTRDAGASETRSVLESSGDIRIELRRNIRRSSEEREISGEPGPEKPPV